MNDTTTRSRWRQGFAAFLSCWSVAAGEAEFREWEDLACLDAVARPIKTYSLSYVLRPIELSPDPMQHSFVSRHPLIDKQDQLVKDGLADGVKIEL